MKRLFLAVLLIFGMSQLCFAGQFVQNGDRLSYYQDDGTYAISKWVEIDTDSDGVNESYYFDSSGFLLVNTITPDGYKVNELGQWMQNIPKNANSEKVDNVQNAISQQIDNNNTSNISGNVTEEIVWYVEKGKKFHKDKTCSKMNNPKQITRSKAESMGLEPCKKSKCYGNYF